MSIYNYFFFLCKRLHLIKFCLCRFLVMHLYFITLSTIATISSLRTSELFPACFSFSNNYNLLHILLESDDKKIFLDSFSFWIFGFGEFFYLREPAMIAGGLSKLNSVLSLVIFRSFCLLLNFISFPNSKTVFRSCGLEGSTMKSKIANVSKRPPSKFKEIILSLKVTIMQFRVTGILVFIKNSFIATKF